MAKHRHWMNSTIHTGLHSFIFIYDFLLRPSSNFTHKSSRSHNSGWNRCCFDDISAQFFAPGLEASVSGRGVSFNVIYHRVIQSCKGQSVSVSWWFQRPNIVSCVFFLVRTYVLMALAPYHLSRSLQLLWKLIVVWGSFWYKDAVLPVYDFLLWRWHDLMNV